VHTRIGLISDIHARPEPLEQALSIFKQEKVDQVLCAGDIAGYYDDLDQTIGLLKNSSCQTVIGNHDQEFLEKHPQTSSDESDFLTSLPVNLNFNLSGKSIFMVHAEPPDLQHGGIKLLDQQGDIIPQQQQLWEDKLQNFNHDILIVGHTHQMYALHLGSTFVINPGSSTFNHSCMVLNLPDMQIQTFALEDQAIIKCWNFSMLYGSESLYPSEKSR